MRPSIRLALSPKFHVPALKGLAMLMLVLSLGACSIFHHKRNDLNTMPVGELYNKAHAALENGQYDYAEAQYQRLIARFPSGEYNEQAQLDLAYAQYKDNKPDEAYSTINRFIKTYPTNKHVDYAYYLRGLINFDRTGGFIERFIYREDAQTRRDQGYNLQSFDDFSELSRRFPTVPTRQTRGSA